MRIAILDYGVGNLHSLHKAVAQCDIEVDVVTDPLVALNADLLMLPGVGAFASAAGRIASTRAMLCAALRGGFPCLGICLGMQLLFEGSDESPGQGIGLIPGRVERLRAPVVPHMGWNTLDDVRDDQVESSGLTMAYYAHSFVGRPTEDNVVSAWTTAGRDRFPAIVRSDNSVGVQFHPEKSSAPGVRFLRDLVAQMTSRRAIR
jgi:imidazole glycerol-phosphate synthase subunit HisH